MIIKKLIKKGCNIRYTHDYYEILTNAGDWIILKNLTNKKILVNRTILKIIKENNLYTFDRKKLYFHKIKSLEETILNTNDFNKIKINVRLHQLYKKEERRI